MDIDIGIWYWVWAYARKGYFHMGVGSGVEIGLNQDRRGLVWLLIFCCCPCFQSWKNTGILIGSLIRRNFS